MADNYLLCILIVRYKTYSLNNTACTAHYIFMADNYLLCIQSERYNTYNKDLIQLALLIRHLWHIMIY